MNATTELMSSVNLTCEAEGHPAPMYEWYLDDILLQGEHLPFLYVPEVAPSDRGSYYCKAINNEGETSSTPANLDIEGNKPYGAPLPCMHFAHQYINFYYLVSTGLYQYSTRVTLNGTSDTDEVNINLICAFDNNVEMCNVLVLDPSIGTKQESFLIVCFCPLSADIQPVIYQ